jgi:4a-hydroxytetrahydrobiopterin dehydratase
MTIPMPLAEMTCEPCPTLPVLTHAEAEDLLRQISPRWRLAEDVKSLACEVRMASFEDAMALLNELARVAHETNHHPNLCLRRAVRVELQLMTFIHNGLTVNDFILAAKMDQVIASAQPAG